MNKFLLSITTLLLILHSQAQKADSVLTVLANNPGEKIYIHYDREYYIAGETIWFKGYLYNSGKPSGTSNNFYLQLVDEKGKIVVTKKYPVKGATVKGDIALPDSLPQGYYRVRAITPAVMSAPGDIYYTKHLYIFNPSYPGSTTNFLTNQPVLSVRFFPESGYLVDGIASVMAFSAVDSLGQPVSISGVIKMDDSIRLNPFQTFHGGIGKIQFKPQVGKKYTAEVNYKGHQYFFSLPEIQSTGINIKVEDEKGGKVFVLSRSRKEKEKFEKIFLLAEIDNRIVYENEISFEDFYSVKGHLITDSLPSGILHFTAFNMDGVPLAERLTFLDNGEYRSTANIEIQKKGIEPRSENIVVVNFTELIQRSCSVSVTAIENNEAESENTIVSSLLLTGDLKGYIRNPSYYFKNPTEATKQALDNVMMTHGWSRYNWTKLLSGDIQVKNIEDNYLISVTGDLRDSKTKTPVGGGKLLLFLEPEDSLNQSYDTEVDATGRFRIDSLLFNGKTKFFYAYSNANGKEFPVDIRLFAASADTAADKLKIGALSRNIFDGLDIPLINDAEVREKFGNMAGKAKLETAKELAPVVLKSSGSKNLIDEVNEKYTRGVFTAMGRSNYDLINEPEVNKSQSVYDFIRKSIKQVTLKDDNFVNNRNRSLFAPVSSERDAQKQKSLDSSNAALGGAGAAPSSQRYLEVKTIGTDGGKNYIVAIFVNESPTIANYLKTIRIDEVALIKYYEPGFIGAGGADGPGGAIAIYTKKDVTPPARLDKLDHALYNGYSITKEFYSPDYSKPPVGEPVEDSRVTLYWNPEVYTSNQSSAVQFRFFNNNRGQRWKIVFEGFDVNGKLIHLEKIITE